MIFVGISLGVLLFHLSSAFILCGVGVVVVVSFIVLATDGLDLLLFILCVWMGEYHDVCSAYWLLVVLNQLQAECKSTFHGISEYSTRSAEFIVAIPKDFTIHLHLLRLLKYDCISCYYKQLYEIIIIAVK